MNSKYSKWLWYLRDTYNQSWDERVIITRDEEERVGWEGHNNWTAGQIALGIVSFDSESQKTGERTENGLNGGPGQWWEEGRDEEEKMAGQGYSTWTVDRVALGMS